MRLAAVLAISLLGALRLHATTIGYVYSNGVFTFIPGVNTAWGINNAGQVVGNIGIADAAVGYLFSNDVLTTLKVPGATETEAWGINNKGQVVGGWGTYPDLFAHSYVYTNGVFTTLNVPGTQDPPNSYALGINDQGDIVGFYTVCSNHGNNCVQHGYLYSNGIYATLDVPGAYSTSAKSINNAGQIVGSYQVPSDYSYHGFLYANGRFTTIDGPSGTGTALFGINNLGVIVGDYLSGGQGAFLDINGVFTTTVAYPGALGTAVSGINDAGQISGHVNFQDSSASPEPGSWTLMAAGFGSLALLLQRRRFARTRAQGQENSSR
jgi:probable HAF family extracellular repeat protein